MLPEAKIKDRRLAEWLRSNPVLDPFKIETKVIALWFGDGDGFLRWPVVPEQIIVEANK